MKWFPEKHNLAKLTQEETESLSGSGALRGGGCRDLQGDAWEPRGNGKGAEDHKWAAVLAKLLGLQISFSFSVCMYTIDWFFPLFFFNYYLKQECYNLFSSYYYIHFIEICFDVLVCLYLLPNLEVFSVVYQNLYSFFFSVWNCNDTNAVP